MSMSIATAAVIVGGLLLERVPKSILVGEAALDDYYPPALQEFVDYCKNDYGFDFEAPDHFRQKVMDNVHRYLDLRSMRMKL